MFCYLNSKLIDENSATISISDRGFLFGDGVFETCHIHNQQILDFDLHLKRLKEGLNFLEISAKIDDLLEKSHKLIKKNHLKNGILRITISRGVGSNGFLPNKNIKPTISIQTKPPFKIPSKPIILGIATKSQLNSKSMISTHKTANSLNYILAKIEAQKNNFFDNILLNEQQYICETSSANIFWCKNQEIFTPSLDCGILNGTKRQRIIKICQQNNYRLNEGFFKLESLENCDEIFLTNSSFLILAISQIRIDNNIINSKNNNQGANINLLLQQLQK